MDSSRKAQAPESITIKRAKNKGFIVRHSFNNYNAGPSYRPDEEHAFSDQKQMMAHVAKHVGASAAPDEGESAPTGVAHKAKASPPNQRTKGAGAD